eukprot:TRINITY_DN1862_c0_g1_i1.p1 TRINITY_DN1862_c0_g1~~TRINITY_DN1862_c0_g1_i1.p1  ORF type:complete len:603 (+),score=133.99 TRINITY_DN1862_c0_g1_i1:244-1809(+)
MYKMQRDEYERKLQSQLGELNNIQQTLYELERNHLKIKQQYEEEIVRLRRQVDLHAGTGASSVGNFPPFGGPTQPSMGSPLNSVNPPVPREVPREPLTRDPLPPQRDRDRDQPPTQQNANPLFLAPIDKNRISFPNASPQPPTAPGKRREPVFSPLNEPAHKQPKIEELPREITREQKIEETKDPKNKEDKDASSLDWIVGYNPSVHTNLNIDLAHTLDHSSVVCCVKFSNDGKCLATGCNKSAQVYDVDTGAKIHLFSEDLNKEGDLYIRSVCFSPDNKFLACGAEDKTVKVWDIAEKRLHHTFTGHDLDIYSLDWSKDGSLIVSGSGDKKAKIWSVERGECIHTLGQDEVGPKDGVTSVAFSPDGRYVAAGSLDRIVRLWDAQTGYFLERFEGHTDSVYSVAFSPDGKSLASGSLDKTLKLWDLSSSRPRSRCRSTFPGHKDFVLSVAFSPDGRWLISGSKDRSVQFWDPRSAVTHMMLQGHKNSVISVAVSPQGGVFATGSGDFRARMWKYELVPDNL